MVLKFKPNFYLWETTAQNAEKKAILDYSNAEKRTFGKKEYDVVLVGVDTTMESKKAYPNYFADTSEFLQNLQKIINKNGR